MNVCSRYPCGWNGINCGMLNCARNPQPYSPQQLAQENERLRQTIRDSIESLERNSTSAPVVECLKAALSSQDRA